jgi:hypothetical protein
LNKADLLIVVGRKLQIGWLPPLIAGAQPEDSGGADRYLDMIRHPRDPDRPITRAMGGGIRRVTHTTGSARERPEDRAGHPAEAVADQSRRRGVARSGLPTSTNGWPRPRSAGAPMAP